uniref:Uncharacterized protein n=1 Tax=Takifugu rubripes TaxID=31033 RepID=A0A3B5K8K5_TAKRU
MDLPFSGFELTFITIAFFIFSLYTLASIFIQPSATESAGFSEENHKISRNEAHALQSFVGWYWYVQTDATVGKKKNHQRGAF